MFVIKLIFVMGCGWGYGNYRSDEQREGPVFIFLCNFSLFGLCSRLCFSGGILGWEWDPVRTTCISDEMMMR